MKPDLVYVLRLLIIRLFLFFVFFFGFFCCQGEINEKWMRRKKCDDGYYFVGCAAAMMIVLWDLLQLRWIECNECELKMIQKRKRRGCLFSRFRMFNLWSKLQKQKIITPPYLAPYVNDPITGAFLYKKKIKINCYIYFVLNIYFSILSFKI